MIITIRGTSGSGKTTCMRRAMALFAGRELHFAPKRKRPLYYTFTEPKVAVLGSYEAACGGCDTVSDVLSLFPLAAELHAYGYHVLMEGLLISPFVRHYAELGIECHNIYLDVSLEKCLEAVADRRAARGVDKPLNPENTVAKARCCDLSAARSIALKMPTYRLDRDAAFAKVLELLDVEDPL